MATKLYVPPLRSNLIPRPQLVERLTESLRLGYRLTIISAPAGFGKTTLLSEWIAGTERPATWVSPGDGDNDMARFWSYVVAALQTIYPDRGGSSLVAPGSSNTPLFEGLITELVNDFVQMPEPLLLVLDDYHVITSSQISISLFFFIENLPPQIHLAISGRSDPPLPLARLRARGEIVSE